MKTIEKVATAKTPDGCDMDLYRHDRDFIIKVKGEDLMSSRMHESELELARLGCANVKGRESPSVLIGGLGLGYTLRQALDILGKNAEVVVSELLESVVSWNHEFLGVLNKHPLKDKRVNLKVGDVVDLISESDDRFDAILLDIDNGPGALTDAANQRLYGREGIMACRRALRNEGYLAVWSAEESKSFERILLSCKLNVRRYQAAAFKGSRQRANTVWVASENKRAFPPGAVLSRNIGH
jgi:spermidine synthase